MRTPSLPCLSLTPAQRWRWLFTTLSCSSCQHQLSTHASHRPSSLNIRRFSDHPAPALQPPPQPPAAPQPTRLSIPSPTTFSAISQSPLSSPPLSGAWFYHSLEDKLRDAESDAQRGNKDAAAAAFHGLIRELLAQVPESSIHQLQQVKRAYIRTFDPSTLPLPLFNRIIVQSTRLQPLLLELRKMKLQLERETVTALLQTAAKLRSADDTIATLRFIREVCMPKLRLTTEDFDDFLRVFAKAGDVQGAMFMYDEMQRLRMQVGLGAYEQLLFACGRGEMVSMAMSLLEHIKASAASRTQTQVSAASSPWGSAATQYALPASLFEHLISGLLISTNRSFDPFPSCLSLVEHMRQLSEAQHSLCPPPTAAIYSSLIIAYSKRGRIREAYDTYISMRRERLLLPTAKEFNALLAAVAEQSEAGDRPGEALNRCMQMMRERIEAQKREGGEPIDVSSFNLLLDLSLQQGRQDALTVVLEWMDASGCKRDVATYNKLIERYASAGAEERERAVTPGSSRRAAAKLSPRQNHSLVLALQMYHELLSSALQPDVATFHTLMAAARDDGDHWLLWCILRDMESANVQPVQVEKSFQLALETAEKGEDVRSRWVLPFFTKLSNCYARLPPASSTPTDASSSASTSPALTSATSAIPANLQHRNAALALQFNPPASSLVLPSAFPRLSKSTYDSYIDALARSPSLPLSLVLGFVNGMTAAGQQVTRQNMKELMMARAERADKDGVLALMGVMMREGMGVDADVVHSLLRVIYQRLDAGSGAEEERGRAEMDSYVTAIDEQLIQPEPRVEHRVHSLSSLFEGLCGSRLVAASNIAVRVLQLLQEREKVAVTPRQTQALFQSLHRHSPSYIQRATELFSLVPTFGLTPEIKALTEFASHAHSTDDIKLLLSTVDRMALKGDAAFYAALLHRQLSMASVSHEVALLLTIVQRMIKDSVKLPNSELSQLIHAARLRQNSNVMLHLWRYMRAVGVDVTAKWLADMARLCRHRDASQINVRWAHELTNYAIERLPVTDDGWTEMVESLLLLQAPLQPADNLCLQLLAAVKQNGRLPALNGAVLYEVAMAALHSRLDKPTEDDKLTIRGLLAAEAGQPDVWSVEMRRLLTRALDAGTEAVSRAAAAGSAELTAISDGDSTIWAAAVAGAQSASDLPPLCTSPVAPVQMRYLPAFYWSLLKRYFALVHRPPGTAHMRDFCHLLTQMQAQQVVLAPGQITALRSLCADVHQPGYVHRVLLYMAEVGLELNDAAIQMYRSCRARHVPLNNIIALRLNHWRITMLKWAARTATEESYEGVVMGLFRGCESRMNHNDVWMLWQAMVEVKQGHAVYERPALFRALATAAAGRRRAKDNGVVLTAMDILQLTEAVHATWRQAVARMGADKDKRAEAERVRDALLGFVQREMTWKEEHMQAQRRKARGKHAATVGERPSQPNGAAPSAIARKREHRPTAEPRASHATTGSKGNAGLQRLVQQHMAAK